MVKEVMHMLEQFPRDELLIPIDAQRALMVVAKLIPPESAVTLEGAPLYAGQPWGQSHEFGTNVLLSAMSDLLRQSYCSIAHYAMVDDFTTGQSEDISRFVLQMGQKPDELYYESQFSDDAQEALIYLRSKGKTFFKKNELLLKSRSMPRLKVQGGRSSCELLDACFQRKKRGEVHVIFHPTEFIDQQRGMRDILWEISERRLPAEFINVFFKNKAMSRIFFTGTDGRTERINF